MGKTPNLSGGMLPGALEMLILRVLMRGPMHGYGIAQQIQDISENVLQVGEGSLYPALQRVLLNDWVTCEWGASEHNRRARFYKLTAAGKKQLASETGEFRRLVGAITRVLETA